MKNKIGKRIWILLILTGISSLVAPRMAGQELTPRDATIGEGTRILIQNRWLASIKGCFACHQTRGGEFAPSFEEVAAKYADLKNPINYLKKRILKGSKGKWGHTPMPAQSSVTAEEATQIAEYILSLNAQRKVQ